MKKTILLLLLFSIISCNNDDSGVQFLPVKMPEGLLEDANRLFVSVSTLPPDNIPENKIALGKKLYFDKQLSYNNTISCNSCHDLNSGYGVDNSPLSLGDSGEFGVRNSPSTIYSFLQFKQFWDGRAETVEDQAKGPILNPVEHGIPDEQYLVDKLKNIPEYQNIFKQVFPEDADPISFTNITSAIGAFERQLHHVSKFDNFLDKNRVNWTQQEINGMKEFIDNKCTNCHNGIGVGGKFFAKFGIYGNYADETHSTKIDKGRYDITNDEKDLYSFKVPNLRNVEKTFPYFHDGSVTELKEAIRIMAKLQLNKELTSNQIYDIEAFLKTLTADVNAKYKEYP